MVSSPVQSGNTAKRPRPDVFTALADWIRQKSGLVHSSVVLANDDANDDSRRELQTTQEIAQGSEVLRIPRACLVTPRSFRVDAVTELLPKDRLYHSLDDIRVALVVASQPDDWRAYLNSLPESTALPRQWSEEQLQWLTGSTLLERIQVARKGVESDYKLLEEYSSKTTFHLPSFQAFSEAMAAVSSRAFQGPQQETTLVPLLDLCNHHRGSTVKKNLSYVITEECVTVHASETIAAGDTLRITYGAQGNAQLLLNYGFCISPNLEPDGSSNDVLEWHPSTDCVVHLRAGPKSYSYGGLVQALEMCRKADEQQQPTGKEQEDDGPDDMEAFLNDCEEDEEDFDWETPGDDDEAFEEKQSVGQDENKSELDALAKFRAMLQKAKAAYKLQGDELEQACTKLPVRQYSAILVKSELRTIYFFLLAIHSIENKLLGKKSPMPNVEGVVLQPHDEALIQKQVQELVNAYVQIRHSDML